jgi:nucleoside-diphosphate-sugar epimerase
MRVLVTGGAGFIGFNLCKILMHKGHEVIALDNFITGTRTNIKKLKAYPHFSFFKHDIVKPLPSVLKQKKINQIYHLACPTGVDNLIPLAEEMILACSIGTKNILELAKLHKAKFLFTSSSEVYGDPLVSPQKESYTGNVDSIGTRSPYEEGKRFSESITAMYQRKFKLNTRIVRIFNTYGPTMSASDTRVIPRFLNQALNGKPLTVKGKGLQRRTFCYVDDLVAGILLVMEKGRSEEVYNIGSDKEISIIKLAKLILDITKSKSTISYVVRPTHDHEMRMPDLGKVKKLGWQAKINLRRGLVKTLEEISLGEHSTNDNLMTINDNK